MNVLIILSLAYYGVAAIPISTTSNNQKIFGGMEARAGQFPYQAMVRLSDDLDVVCGGSIISNEWILTSVGCIEMAEQNTARIVVGSIYLNSGGITYTILSTIRHPDFNEDSAQNDIGLIRVNGRINYNNFVQPIPLFGGSTSVDSRLTASGWGLAGGMPEWHIPTVLQYTALKSISLAECRKKVNELLPTVELTDRQLCTNSNDGKGLCIFDNGGPVVYNEEQHAIASLSYGCINIPDVHTRVAPYRSWIKSITNV